MALLRAWNRNGRASRASILVGILFLAGCVLTNVFEAKVKPFAFSHRVHVVDQGLACTDCHRNTQKGEDPGMPSAKQCALCHDEQDAEKPEDHKVTTLYEAKKYKAAHAGSLADEIVFSHQKHALQGLECTACHAGIEQNDVVSTGLALSMDQCSACHVQRSVPNDCAVCHAEIRKDVAPPNHSTTWPKQHGEVVRACTGQTQDRCELCHKETDCSACHQTQAPANHTGYWHRRGHGIVASMDREGCATCHTPDSCARCHAETTPASHTGSFGAPLDRHCLGCHEPLQGEGCYVCHTSTPSHAMAPPKPPSHNAAMDCRMCHGNGQPLPHVDNGQDCNLCHH